VKAERIDWTERERLPDMPPAAEAFLLNRDDAIRAGGGVCLCEFEEREAADWRGRS